MIDDAHPGWRKQPRQARARSTIDCILEATRQLLADGRPLNTNAVAERAGVSIGTFYQYFPNKNGLLQAWFEAELASLRCPVWRSPLGPTATAIAHAVYAWWTTPARQAAWRLLDDAARHPFRLLTLDRLFEATWPDAKTRPMALTAGLAGQTWGARPPRPPPSSRPQAICSNRVSSTPSTASPNALG
jgi:AcrR family transcriptional regulator